MLSTETLQNRSVVYIIDNDEKIRDSLSLLLTKNGYNVSCYDNAQSFLNFLGAARQLPLSCALLDVNLGELSGIDLQKSLIDKGINLPLTFVTDNCEVATAVEALKQGAFDYIQKPVQGDIVCNQVAEMLLKAYMDREEDKAFNTMRSLFKTLTARELQILECITEGRTNKQIGLDLDISIKTVEQHRSNIMEKLMVKRPAGLLNLIHKYQRNTAN